MVAQRKEPRRIAMGTVGETTITGKNQISLPAEALRQLGWEKGDHVLVQNFGDDTLVLMRKPASWADAFSGKMGHVFGDHEDTMRYLDELRQEWEEWAEERGI